MMKVRDNSLATMLAVVDCGAAVELAAATQ